MHTTGLAVTFAVHMPTAPREGSNLERDWRALLRGERHVAASGIVLGYRYASGEWRSTIDGAPEHLPLRHATAPISQGDGGNRGRSGTVAYWLWPLPEGDITFFGRWHSQGLDYGEVTVPIATVLNARPTS